MGTLTYGYYKPEDGDKGKTLFEKLENNWQLVNDHNHDGVGSAKLSSQALEASSQIAPNGSWTSVGDGIYRQTITTVGGLDHTKYNLAFYDNANGNRLYLDHEFISANSFYLYINDNTKDVKVLYS